MTSVILVTGGAGFIGSHLVDRLLELGHDVAVVDDLSSGRPENVNPGARLYPLDVRDAGLVPILRRVRPEVICHLAANTDVRLSACRPLEHAAIGVLGSLNVLHAAAAEGVRKVVFASSGGAIYGDQASLPASESEQPRPTSVYGASKLAVEGYLQAYLANGGLDHTVLRLPNVYGPRQRGDGRGGVVSVFASAMLADRTCTIHGDGGQERDFLYVADCVAAIEAVLGAAGGGRTFNLGWGRGVGIRELFDMIASRCGYVRPAVYAPARPGEVYRSALDAGRARGDLGWRPVVTLEEGLDSTLAWFERRRSVSRPVRPQPRGGCLA